MSERPRASQTRQAMMRGMSMPPRPAPSVPEPDEDEKPASSSAVRPAAESSAKVKPVTSKFTANLDADTAAEFDGLALMARRKLGRRVDKLDLLKALVRLAADDASLRDQVISEVEKGTQLNR